MKLKDLVGDYALVTKVSVKSVITSAEFYATKLGFTYEPEFTFDSGNFGDGSWIQLAMSDIGDNVSIGLYGDPQNAGTQSEVTTFVVRDILTARNALIREGIEVSEVDRQSTDEGNKIYLAYFQDPDGNQLGIRQNEIVTQDKHRSLPSRNKASV